MSSFTEARLRQIIIEELQALHVEAVDHEGVKIVVNGASKLLKAIEAFKNDANIAMTNAVTPNIDEVAAVLESMISTPASYVDQKAVEPKVVKLRKVDD